MNIQVTPHIISLAIDNDINAGEYNITQCNFTFTEEYDSLTKEAVFSDCYGHVIKKAILNNTCIIPYEVLETKGNVLLGVFAYETDNNELVLRYSPKPQYFNVKNGSYKEGNDPELPKPTEWEQVLEQINEAITETNNLNITASKENHTTTITITKKDGTTQTVQILDGADGQPGQDATINGENTVNIVAGDNIGISQSGTTLTISATGGSGGTTDYEDLSNKPKINNVELIGNKTTSDLGLFSGNYNDLTNKPVENGNATISSSGNTITLNNTVAYPMEIEYKGNTSKADTPTPSSPQTVHTVSGNNSIMVANGDNSESKSYSIDLGTIELCKIGDYQDKIIKSNGNNLININESESGGINASGEEVSASGNWRGTVYIPVEPNKKYTFSLKTSNLFRLYEYNASKQFISPRKETTATSYTITTSANTRYLKWTVYNSSMSLDYIKSLDIMLNEGSTALPYEPYEKGWYIKKEIGKITLDGTENGWGLFFSTSGIFVNSSLISSLNNSATINCISDKFANTYTRTYIRNNLSGSYDNVVATNGGELIIVHRDISSATDFKTWLTTNNVVVYYVLSYPTYIKITNETLIQQLEAVKRSYETQTNIAQTNNDLPFELSVTAYANTFNGIIGGINKEIDNCENLEATGGNISIIDYNATTQSNLTVLQQFYSDYLQGKAMTLYFKNDPNSSSPVISLLPADTDGSTYADFTGLLIPTYGSMDYGVSYKMFLMDRVRLTLSNGQVTNYTISTETVGVFPENSAMIMGLDNDYEFEPQDDYQPATKKYVDDMVGSINTVLATLTTPGGGN